MSVLQMSILAGLLIIITVIIRAIALHRLPKVMFLLLWFVVLIRLLVPIVVPINIELLPNVEVLPIIEPTLIGNSQIVTTTRPYAEAIQTQTTQVQAPNTNLAAIIWLAGMIVAFIFFAIVYFKNQKVLKNAIPIQNNDFLNEWLAKNRIRRSIEIMQLDKIKSPFAAGIIKPRIILPKSMALSDNQLLDYVLTHELHHIKRFDALWKMLMLVALCIHWFNPLVWLMFALANRDLELTCDEAVIRRFGETTKKTYAYMLIGLAEQGGFAPLNNGFSKSPIKERMVSIMKMKKKSLLSVAMAALLVSMLSFGVFTAFAATSATRERLEVLLDEANIEIMPYELRERLNLNDGFIPESEMDSEVLDWLNERVREEGRVFLAGDPAYLLEKWLSDPEIYALIQEGAEWDEIMEFIINRALTQLQLGGRTIHRLSENNVRFIPASPNFRFDWTDHFADEFVYTQFGRLRPISDIGIEHFGQFELLPSSLELEEHILSLWDEIFAHLSQ